MDGKLIIAVLLFLAALAASFVYYRSQETKRTFKAEVLKGLNRTGTSEKLIIGENDIKGLPEPVQKYLSYVGVVGKEKVQNVRFKIDIEMNMGPEKNWPLMKVEQYDFFDSHPARLSLMQLTVRGIPTIGLDSYIDGKGSMLMMPFGLVKVVDAKGKEMDDKSAAAILLSEMCISAPASLIDNRIEWETIDPLTVKATFNDKGLKVSGILSFNDNGELISFSTEDKYHAPDGKTYKKVRWSAPVKNYKDMNGLRLPTYSEAVWHFDEGDYCYGKAHIKELEYNCESFK